MMHPFDPDTSIGGRMKAFPSTHHPLVRAAAAGSTLNQDSQAAISAVYWKPIYTWVRVKWRRSNEDAKDLTQGFFTMLFEQGLLGKYQQDRGSFRSWIRGCLDNFVSRQDEFSRRAKRGGHLRTVGLEMVDLETGDLASEPAEDVFLQEWRRQIFALALEDFESHCRLAGHDLRYRLFARYDLAEEARPRYEDLAAEFDVPATTVTNHLAWARRELRRLVLARLEPVTGGPNEARAESRILFQRP